MAFRLREQTYSPALVQFLPGSSFPNLDRLLILPPVFSSPVPFTSFRGFFLMPPVSRTDPHLMNEDVPTPLWKDVTAHPAPDLQFRNFLISRIISQFGMMAFAFYTVYAVKDS